MSVGPSAATIPPMDVATPAVLTDRMREFLGKPNYATLATVGEDGEPHQAVIWYRLEPGDRILVNSRTPRRWPTELRRDGRCSLAITDLEDPFSWVGLQAEVEALIDDVEVAREDIVALAVRYAEDDEDSVARFRTQPRISFRLRVVRAHDHLDD
jgi:PPOX class probable F420-dependent enzyme